VELAECCGGLSSGAFLGVRSLASFRGAFAWLKDLAV
jgi:hypothetical protein